MTLSENARTRATAALGQACEECNQAYLHALKFRPRSGLESLGRAEAKLVIARNELLTVIKAEEK
jgi:hypothetical protein